MEFLYTGNACGADAAFIIFWATGRTRIIQITLIARISYAVLRNKAIRVIREIGSFNSCMTITGPGRLIYSWN